MFIYLANKINIRPKTLFLIDGFGALFSAFFLGIVLVKFQIFIGIPISALYFLTIFPVIFLVYNLYCFQKKKLNVVFCLKAIAILNSFYCLLSFLVVSYHYNTITKLGLLYFGLEIFVIILLIFIEFSLVFKLKKN